MIDRESEYAHRTDKIMGLEAFLKRFAWEHATRADCAAMISRYLGVVGKD